MTEAALWGAEERMGLEQKKIGCLSPYTQLTEVGWGSRNMVCLWCCGGFILLFASFYYFYEGLKGSNQQKERGHGYRRREDSIWGGRGVNPKIDLEECRYLILQKTREGPITEQAHTWSQFPRLSERKVNCWVKGIQKWATLTLARCKWKMPKRNKNGVSPFT